MKHSVIWATLLAATPAFAGTAPTELGGIHVIGQAIDGTLVLDGNRSDLTTWESTGLAVASQQSVDDAPTLLVIGHIEGFDAKEHALTVSGQHITLQDDAVVIDAPRDIDAQLTEVNVPWYLATGRYVAVAGNGFGENTNLASHVIRLDNEARPGQVPIYVRGSIQSSDEISGIATLGDVALDLNSARQEYFPAAGNMVELLAYRASEGSAIVTDYASLEPSLRRGAKVAGISGTGVKGISGTGVKGISGTGVKGISGTGVKGISGTGVKGISGTGVKGISGTGVK